MTEVRVRGRRHLDTGEKTDWRSDTPTHMAMKMAMAVTSIAAGTAGEATFELMERNENRKQRRCEVPVTAWAPRDWRCHMEPVAQQQARELAQLH
jgi:hypothetical protein